MSDGEFFRMCKGKKRLCGSEVGEAGGRSAMKPQLWRTASADDFDTGPVDASRNPGAQRFHGGFLGGESGGERRRGVALAPAIPNLPRGEHPRHEALSVAVDGGGHPRDLCGVKAEADDIHRVTNILHDEPDRS